MRATATCKQLDTSLSTNLFEISRFSHSDLNNPASTLVSAIIQTREVNKTDTGYVGISGAIAPIWSL